MSLPAGWAYCEERWRIGQSMANPGSVRPVVGRTVRADRHRHLPLLRTARLSGRSCRRRPVCRSGGSDAGLIPLGGSKEAFLWNRAENGRRHAGGKIRPQLIFRDGDMVHGHACHDQVVAIDRNASFPKFSRMTFIASRPPAAIFLRRMSSRRERSLLSIVACYLA